MSNNTRVPVNRFLPVSLMLTLDKAQVGFDVFAMLFGGLGNTLVLFVLGRKKERTHNDMYVANLAIADVMFIVMAFPEDLLKALQQAPGSLVYCSSVRPLITMFFCLGLFTICLMAGYRCFVVVNPHRPKVNVIFINISIAIAWLVAFLSALPAMIAATVAANGYCWGKWKSPAFKDAYILFLLLIKCIVPLTLIGLAYIRLGVFLVWQKSVVTSSASIRRHRIENMKIVRMIAMIVILFALCTLPYQIGWALLQFGDVSIKAQAALTLRVTRMIQNLHTCTNPVIYGISRKEFRREYKQIFKMVFCVKNGQRTVPENHAHGTGRSGNTKPSEIFENQQLNQEEHGFAQRSAKENHAQDAGNSERKMETFENQRLNQEEHGIEQWSAKENHAQGAGNSERKMETFENQRLNQEEHGIEQWSAKENHAQGAGNSERKMETFENQRLNQEEHGIEQWSAKENHAQGAGNSERKMETFENKRLNQEEHGIEQRSAKENHAQGAGNSERKISETFKNQQLSQEDHEIAQNPQSIACITRKDGESSESQRFHQERHAQEGQKGFTGTKNEEPLQNDSNSQRFKARAEGIQTCDTL